MARKKALEQNRQVIANCSKPKHKSSKSESGDYVHRFCNTTQRKSQKL